MAAALLERGASRMARDEIGRVPLHNASSRGFVSCVILMVGWPGNAAMMPSFVDSADEDGLTPLHLAAYCGRLKSCGVLIGAGAKLDSSRGISPLMLAKREHPTNKELLALLSGKVLAGKLPGTVCAACGETATLFCPACGGGVYCGAACREDAQAGHQAACKAGQAELKEKTEVKGAAGRG